MAAINHNQQFKITKLAKDLGLKSKDLVEILAKNGIEAKTTQKALEPNEFDILFDRAIESLVIDGTIKDFPSRGENVVMLTSFYKTEQAVAKKINLLNITNEQYRLVYTGPVKINVGAGH